jgi:hypothetical protein
MSTFLDFSIKTREDFKNYIYRKLGGGLIQVELTDEQFEDCINDAVEEYSQWVIEEQDYYAAPLDTYDTDAGGLKLPDNVLGVFAFNDDGGVRTDGINTLFSVENSLWNASGGSWPFMGAGGWTTYHLAMQSIELTKRMTGGGYQFEYNPRTKYLKLFPDPVKLKANVPEAWIVLGVYILRNEDQMYGESWVKRMALAHAKILLGTIRSKYEGVQILGGGTIDTSIKDEGISERDALLEEIREMFPAIGFWIG